MTKEIAVVTGGAGFIGSHAVDILVKKGYQVRIIDDLTGGRLENIEHHKNNPDVEFFNKDIRAIKPDDKIFHQAKFVIHFAGKGDIVPSIEQPIEYMDINVQGTVRILEAARFNNLKKFVYAASSSCYGLATQLPTTEMAPIDTQYPYALSKYQGEQAVFHWGKVYKLPVVALRIFNAYGTRSKTSGAYGAVFGVFLKQKLAGKPFTLVGDGKQTRDFLYVTDVANAFVMAAESNVSGEFFNLGAGNPQSVNKLVELMKGDVVHMPKRPGEPDCTWADISKITKMLGWKPHVSFEQGVGEVLKNIDYWKNAPLWDPDSIKKATETWFKYL